MGCFLGCFGSSKDQKRRKQTYKVIPRDQNHGSHKSLQATVSTEPGNTEKPTNSVPELRYTDKNDEQLSLSTRKKVTFDSNIKTYEHVVYESTDSLPDEDKISEKEKNGCVPKSSQPISSEDDSITSSVGSYPPNHRYQNCQESDNEVEESDYEESDLDSEDDDVEEQEDYDYDEDGDARIVCKEVWSESIPTELVESRTEVSSARVTMEEIKRSTTPMCGGFAEQEIRPIGLNRNARDRSVYVHPVLNPVENLSQWKAVKSKGTPPLKPQKENFNGHQEEPRISFSSEPSFKQLSFSFKSQSHQPKNPNQEIALDASLSNWLVSPETTTLNKKATSIGFETISSAKSISQGSPSPSLEDRPILGALTVEELRQFSSNSSPRKSPSRSPDDMPIIGTVGTYWNHKGTAKDSGSASSYKGIPNTTSKYREDKRVNWHSTPFETRLERALKRGGAET